MSVPGRLALTLLASSVLLACSDHDDMREDVLLCEQAVAHVTHCCGDPPLIQCVYSYDADLRLSASGPGDKEVHPDLCPDQSRALMQKSCESLAPSCHSPLEKGRTWSAGLGCR